MSIANRIEQIKEHINNAYSTLEIGGANINSINKNIDNISSSLEERLIYYMNNGLSVVWNNWNKITSSGALLELHNTIKAPISLTLKGNTVQTTFTGKNKLNYVDNLRASYGGLTSVINSDGSITTTGLPNGDYRCILEYNITDDLEDGATYTFWQETANAHLLYLQINAKDISTSQMAYYSLNTGEAKKTLTINKSKYTYTMNIQTESVSSWNQTSKTLTNKYMLEKGSDKTSFEPYCGAEPSPNPLYPQEVQVVKGHNSTKVNGKNLFDGMFRQGGWSGPATTRVMSVNGIVTDNTSTQYTISTNLDTSTYCWGVSESKQTLPRTSFDELFNSGWLTTSSYTFTCSKNGYLYITIAAANKTDDVSINAVKDFKFQVERGGIVTEYEVYDGKVYPISFPVENKWYIEPQSAIGVTLSYQDGVTILNGTTNTTWGALRQAVNLSGTYTLSVETDAIKNNVYVRIRDSNENILQTVSIANSTKGFATITSNDIAYLEITLGAQNINFDRQKIKIQLEQGDKVNDFTPYGVEPIEFCKIVDNSDVIKKGTGKNKITFLPQTKTMNGLTMVANEDGSLRVYGTATATGSTYFTLKENILLGNKTYSFSGKVMGTLNDNLCSLRLVDSDGNSFKNDFLTINSSIVRKLTSSAENGRNFIKCLFYYTNGTKCDFTVYYQLEENSVVTEWEPGNSKDKWYIEKQIGYRDILGTGDTAAAGPVSEGFYLNTGGVNWNHSLASKDVFVNKFIAYPTYSAYNAQSNAMGYIYTSVNQLYIKVKGISTLEAMNTFLSSNNVRVYYVLNAYRYIILNDTLQKQLNDIQDMKSFDNITILTQDNNYLPIDWNVGILTK